LSEKLVNKKLKKYYIKLELWYPTFKAAQRRKSDYKDNLVG